VLGTLALIDTASGELARAAIYMLVALSIDSVDGTLARRVGVSTLVPSIDGRRLDDIVDYFNYAVVPAFFLVEIGALPDPLFVVPILLASAYGFSQQNAKTEDAFFLGWPSYWNVVAIDIWLLDVSQGPATAIVLLLSALVFVPLKYVYPSRLKRMRVTVNLGGLIWILATAAAVTWPERTARFHLAEWTLVYPALYVGVSAWLGDWLGDWLGIRERT
jgi:phosphatidylcholine synthase